MNYNGKCFNGSEISTILWKIGQEPWKSSYVAPFSQGDLATALLSVKLNDCDTFEGKTLEAFVQVPNTANDIVKMFATIDSDNKAIFTLPRELLWYPGDYNINFMYADGDKVNYSNVTNNAYKVISNPALAGQTPPTILPGDKAEYEDLISRLNMQTTKADTQIPALKTENDRADILIPSAKSTNDALNLVNEEGKKVISDGNTAQTSWQDTIDNGDAKIGELNQKITEADDKITDIDNRIVQAEQEITDMETRIDDGIAKVDAAVNALPDEVKKITDETAAGIQSLQNQEATSKGNIDTYTTGKIGEIDTEATAKIGEIDTEGTNNKNEVTAEGNKQKSEIIAEGTNQKTLVKNQGDSSLAAVVKVEEDVKKILVDNPGSLNALSLSGKTRAEFDNEISNNAKQLQNCFEKPHPSLEYALFVENGELKEWSRDGESKLQTREQVSDGKKDTRSLSGNGLNGVIGQDNLNIGENSYPRARCVLEVNWTSEDHSFIFFNYKNAKNTKTAALNNISTASYFPIYSNVVGETVNAIGNSIVGTVSYSANLTEFRQTGQTMRVNNNNEIRVTGFVTNSERPDHFGAILSYADEEKRMTKEELEKEMEKWGNGKIKLDHMGFVENIPNSKKRMDKSGILKTHINITNAEKDEDIYPANEGDMYEVIDSPIPTYVTVGVDGNIPVGSKIKNVAGYIRSDEANVVYPFRLRVVK